LVAFDKIQIEGSEIKDFSILDAINTTSELKEIGMPADESKVENKIDDSIDANEFINIDADIAFEMLSDNDIICNIESKNNHLTEEKY
ncbi:10753_t:CDS:2, partial [Scutellospora calospora]